MHRQIVCCSTGPRCCEKLKAALPHLGVQSMVGDGRRCPPCLYTESCVNRLHSWHIDSCHNADHRNVVATFLSLVGKPCTTAACEGLARYTLGFNGTQSHCTTVLIRNLSGRPLTKANMNKTTDQACHTHSNKHDV